MIDDCDTILDNGRLEIQGWLKADTNHVYYFPKPSPTGRVARVLDDVLASFIKVARQAEVSP